MLSVLICLGLMAVHAVQDALCPPRMGESSCLLERAGGKTSASSLLQATISRNTKLAVAPSQMKMAEDSPHDYPSTERRHSTTKKSRHKHNSGDGVERGGQEAGRQAQPDNEQTQTDIPQEASQAAPGQAQPEAEQAQPDFPQEASQEASAANMDLVIEPRNLCIDLPGDGKYLAPEFLLLGAEKAATSTFDVMFNTAGVFYPTNFNDSWLAEYPVNKELTIFNMESRFDMGRGFWLHHYPECLQTSRMVGIDFTPSYLADEKAAERIQAFYGDQSSQIKFGVILRDPIKRMHSAFHFWKQGQGKQLCSREDIDVEFQDYVLRMLDQYAPADPCDLLYSGDYAVQLQRYFEVFDASQFSVFLFKQVVAPVDNSSTVISDLWQRLGLQGEDVPPEAPHVNVNDHPSLHEELDANTLVALESHLSLSQGAEKLATMLTTAEEMPMLAEYVGEGDIGSVVTWIKDNW